MKVGAIEETITVSGETPIVDTQSVRRQVTVVERHHQLDARRAVVCRRHDADSRHDHAGGRQSRYPGHARHARVRRRRRTHQRSAHSGRWSQHRRGVQRRRRVELCRRHRQRAGNFDDDLRRSRRSRGRRAVIQHRAQDGRQLAQGHRVRIQRHQRDGRRQLHRRAEDRGADDARQAATKLWDYNLGLGGPSRRTRCGSSSSSATKAATGRCRACSRTRTWAIRPSGPTRPIRRVRPSRRAAGETPRCA